MCFADGNTALYDKPTPYIINIPVEPILTTKTIIEAGHVTINEARC